jgi:predicted PurR-regulated permease PerM
MALLDSKQQRAAFLILVLGVALVIAIWPYSTGLIGAPVLYIVFAPMYRWLARRMPEGLAAGIVIVVALALIIGPGISFVTLVASEAQQMAGGVLKSSALERLSQLRIGPYDVGAQLEEFGTRLASWVGTSAFGFIGTATRLGIQLTIAFFGLYYLLRAPRETWHGVRPFIPFSRANSEVLRKRFKDVTVSTLLGTFATAVVQGVFVGIGFTVAGLSNGLFWGVVTVIVSILPVVGSGLIWVPGVVALVLDKRYGWAIGLGLWGLFLVGNVDNVIRPWIFRHYAQIHPFITVIGAFAGIQYFGLLGLLIGPLAISYFFELIRMYRAEYLEDDPTGDTAAETPGQQAAAARGRAAEAVTS